MTLPALTLLPESAQAQLQAIDRQWQRICRGENLPIPETAKVVREFLGAEPEFDGVICGGTLGILLATALQRRGWRIAVLERGILRGRDQEWNISRTELQAFLTLDLLTSEELETAIATEYNPARIAFYEGIELWVRDVLNVGVDPVYLLATLKEKFCQAGGIVLEHTTFDQALIHPDGVTLSAQTSTGRRSITTRLLIDAMGHRSPLVAQVRQNQRPDGVCLVVGSCAQGYNANETGDILVTTTAIAKDCQYFWEAFPARDGRTTYLFTYADPHPDRLGITELMADYLALLPDYQRIDLGQLTWTRFLSGLFPAYRQSPVQFPWGRVLAVGDSAGGQSPVSFGGFGAMVRHLGRLTDGIHEALTGDYLSAGDLALLQPYQPNVSVTWLFQQTMGVPVGRTVNPQQINQLMSGVFQVMAAQGDEVLKPFLQDVIQFGGLTQTLPRVDPRLVLPLLPQIGLPALVDWLRHYGMLGLYTLAHRLTSPSAPATFAQKQRQAAWQYGAGLDFHRM